MPSTMDRCDAFVLRHQASWPHVAACASRSRLLEQPTSVDSAADWSASLACCLRRIRRWRVPPSWSRPDWFEEMHAEANAAAWSASCDFDPERGIPFPVFLRSRVLARAYTRYRQEWRHARRSAPLDAIPHPSTPPGTQADSRDLIHSVRAILAKLPDRDKTLIHQLYNLGLSQRTVAATLGISQVAVCKRHMAIISCVQYALAQHSLASANDGYR